MAPTLEEHRHVLAETVKDGLEEFKRSEPDITFIDLGLPDGEGFELLDQILKVKEDAFVVMMTVGTNQGNAQEAKRRGAKACIGKPLSPIQISNYISLFQSEQSS